MLNSGRSHVIITKTAIQSCCILVDKALLPPPPPPFVSAAVDEHADHSKVTQKRTLSVRVYSALVKHKINVLSLNNPLPLFSSPPQHCALITAEASPIQNNEWWVMLLWKWNGKKKKTKKEKKKKKVFYCTRFFCLMLKRGCLSSVPCADSPLLSRDSSFLRFIFPVFSSHFLVITIPKISITKGVCSVRIRRQCK